MFPSLVFIATVEHRPPSLCAQRSCSQPRIRKQRVATRWAHRLEAYVPRSGMHLRTLAKDRQDFVGGFRGGKTLAHRAVIQKFRYGSQRAQMRLELIFRYDKKNNEFHRRVIQRVELNPFGRSTERSHHFIESIG